MKKFVKDYIYLLKEGYKFKSFTRSTNKEEETLN